MISMLGLDIAYFRLLVYKLWPI